MTTSTGDPSATERLQHIAQRAHDRAVTYDRLRALADAGHTAARAPEGAAKLYVSADLAKRSPYSTTALGSVMHEHNAAGGVR